jgi:hypothetical protein
VYDFEARKLCRQLLAPALMGGNGEALRRDFRGFGQGLGLVEQPHLIGVDLIVGRLLGGSAEQLRLEPAVLFLKQ